MSKPSRQSDNPYVGPRTFEPDEGHLYFGREREARDLLSLVMSERLVLFYGPSAGGKSSLINTRLIPGLEEQGFEVLPKGRVGGTAPPETPVDNVFVHNLLLSLNREGDETRPLRDPNMTISDFLWQYGADVESAGEEDTGATAVGESQDQVPGDPDIGAGELVPDVAEEELLEIWPRALIIDQFEEILVTNLQEWEKRGDFFRQLAHALADDEYLWVILAIREDYVTGLEPYSHLLPGKLKAGFYLQRMGSDAALKAVTGPVAKRRPFEDGVAEVLVDHLRQLEPHEQVGLAGPAVGQYVKPVQLQVVCHYLWEDLREHPGDRITHDDLKRLAGGVELAVFVEQAMGKFYEQAIREVLEERTGLTEFELRDWFEHKVITRDRNRSPVLRKAKTTGGLDNDVVEDLEERFLLRSESRAGTQWYELVHDRMILPILRSNAAWRRGYPLIEDAQRWENTGKYKGYLYRGEQIEEALEKPEASIPLVRAFLEEAKEAEEQRAQARNYKLMALIAGLLTIAAAVLVAALIWALDNEKRAEWAMETATVALGIARTEGTAAVQQRDRAEEAEATATAALGALEAENRGYNVLDLAEAARRSLDIDQDLSLLLAVQAVSLYQEAGIPPPIEAEDALQQAVLKARGEAAVLLGRAGRIGELLFVADELGVYAVDWSPDGSMLATAGEMGTAILWDAATGEQRLVLPWDRGPTSSLDFGPDGRWLATGSLDGTVQLWDLQAEDPAADPLVLRGHEDEVFSVAFSPDGRWLASGSLDATARIWDLQAEYPAAEPLVLSDHEEEIYAVAFSPDGRWLATGSADATARLWDLQAEDPAAEPLVLSGHEWLVFSVAFSPDGRWLATGSFDGTARLWDLQAEDPAAEPPVLRGHEGEVFSVAFSPDGRWLATASLDGTVRVSDLQRELRGMGAPRQAFLDFGDGSRLLEAHQDGVLAVWDISSHERQQIITATGQITITDAVFDQAGLRLMASGGEEWLRAWAAGSGRRASAPSLEARDILTGVVDLAFSTDGSRLAAASEAGAIALWDLTTEQLLWALPPGELASISEPADATEQVGQRPVPTPEGSPAPAPEAVAPSAEIKPQEVGMVVRRLTLDEDGSVLSVAVELRQIVPTESQLAPTSQTVILSWDVDADEKLPDRILAERIEDLALSPGGDLAAAAIEYGDVLVWDPRTRDEPLRLAPGDRVDALLFSPDGKRLATATEVEIKLWDVFNPGGKSVTLPSAGGVWDLAFSPDDSYLAVAAPGGGVELYPLDVKVLREEACGMVTRNLTQLEWEAHKRAVKFPQICPQQPLHDTVVLELLRKSGLKVTRDNVAEAEDRASKAGYELDIAPDDAIADAYIAWAEELVAEGDYYGAVVKLERARQEVPDLAREIGLGETVTGTVDSQAGDVWALAGKEGQLLTIAMEKASSESDPFLYLYGPDGQRLTSDNNSGGRLNALIVGFRLPEDGTYLVNADGRGDTMGAYSLTVEETKVEPVRLGQPVTGTTGQDTLWTFEGQEDQVVWIEVRWRDERADTRLTLAGEGDALETWHESGPLLSVLYRLPAPDTYTLLVHDLGGDAETYTLTVDAPQTGGILRAGESVTGEVSGGSGDVWTYDGADGVWIDMSSADFAPSLSLYSSSGRLAGRSIAANPEDQASVGLSGISEPPQTPEELLIVARSAEAGGSGSYTLSLSQTRALDLPQACDADPDASDIDSLQVGDSVILAPPRLVEGAWLKEYGIGEGDPEESVGRQGIVVKPQLVDEQGCPFVLVEVEGGQLVSWRVRDLRLVVTPEG